MQRHTVKVQSSRFQPVEEEFRAAAFWIAFSNMQKWEDQLPGTKCHHFHRQEVPQNHHCTKYFPLLQRIAWWVEFESWPPQGRCPAKATNFQHPACQNLSDCTFVLLMPLSSLSRYLVEPKCSILITHDSPGRPGLRPKAAQPVWVPRVVQQNLTVHFHHLQLHPILQ